MADRTPAQIGKANRRNGQETERKVRDHLRTWWPDLDYTHAGGPTRQHTDDRGDLAPLVDRDGDHWTIQVKGPRAQPDPGEVERWAAEAAAQADANGRGGLWVLVVRRPGTADVGRWWAVLEAAALFDLVGAYNADGERPFRIVVNAWATVTDGGVDSLDEVAWDDDAPCRCAGCGHTGTVAAFHALPQLGGRYFERVTSDRPPTGDDERLVRDLLDGSPGCATGGDTTP